MKLLPSNQSDNKFGLFGLLANRLLYKGAAEAVHKIPHDEVSGTEEQVKKKYEAYIKALQTEIERYNKTYGDDAEDKKDTSVYADIKLDLKNLPAMRKQIQDLLAELQDKKGETWQATWPSDPQHKMLDALLSSILIIESLPQRGRESVEGAHRGRLQERHEQMAQAGEKRELWEKKPAYKELSGVFDSLAATPAFRDVWQTPEGLSTQKQREAKQLFFAIMAEQTNGFEDTFVLGEFFGNEPDENIKNFPFIYNEFLKIEGAAIKADVSLDKIVAAESDVNSAKRNLPPRTAEQIILANQTGGGIAVGELPAEPSMPDSNGWQQRQVLLLDMARRLEESAKNSTDLPQKAGWEAAAADLRLYAAHAQACLYLSDLKNRESLVKSKFTRSELSRPERRRMVMELAMRQFGKAMEMVDKGPYGNSDWQRALHPTVRRMLIATIYENGVAAYKTDETGKVTYEENINSENVWMMSALSLSDYFNFKEVGESMDADHEALLKAAYLGSRVAVLVEDIKPTEGVLAAWIAVRKKFGNSEPTTPADKKFVEDQMGGFSPELKARFAKYSEQELTDILTAVRENRTKLQEFLDGTKAAIRDPYSAESKKFIEYMKAGEYAKKMASEISYLGQIGVIEGASLELYIQSMNDLQINFKTAELKDKNMLMFFEGLGMNIEGVYPKYLEAIKKDRSLKAEYWDQLLLGSDAEFKKLITLFQVIIPDSIAGGKEDFIAGLQSLRKKYKGKIPLTQLASSQQEGSEDAVILNVFRMLKIHLTGRAETFASSDRQQKDIEARMNGAHIGDKISKYVGGVWDMVAGPGQSPANRIAGLVLMYGFYKSARMAMKGDTKAGKALRALFVAGAVEIAAKEITGRGVLDRLGMDSIAGAMEGTYEAVLLQDAETRMKDKDITPEAHAAALMELNDVPFSQLMAWYESSDPNGMPRIKGSKDLFPRQINLNRIGPKVTWDVKDKKLEARRVVYETVKHFFGYVGDKDNHRDDVHGKEALKERWITMVNNPNYKPKYSDYDHSEWLSGGVRKSDITWQMVMRTEIDPREVDLTRGKTPLGQLETGARELYADLSEWTRQYVANPAAGYAENFLREMGEGAQKAQDFFAEVYKTSERKVYFAKDRVILWYKEHQYEIWRTAENHYDLLVTGIKMPFKLVYAVDGWAIPWSLTKLNQVEESLRSDKSDTTNRDLDAGHITTTAVDFRSSNKTLNPKFAFYGVYQEDFLNALTGTGNHAANKPKDQWFYENPYEHVGYYISEMTEQEAGINPDDPQYKGHPDAVRSKMVTESHKKAEQKFRNMNMEPAEIEKYLYPIHTIEKTTVPKKMYVFWRMPLRESQELALMESGRWADYKAPDRRKDRRAFEVDPSQTSWENLQRAFAIDMGPTRTLVAKAGMAASLIPRVFFGSVEILGKIAKPIARYFGKNALDKKRNEEAVGVVTDRSPATTQFIDESFTSAGNEHMALSAFYKDPVNAKLYRFALEYAQKNSVPLFLGLMQGRKVKEEAYEGFLYLDHSDPPKAYTDMLRYYNENYARVGKPDKDIEHALDEALRKAQNPIAAPAPQGAGAGP